MEIDKNKKKYEKNIKDEQFKLLSDDEFFTQLEQQVKNIEMLFEKNKEKDANADTNNKGDSER